MGWSRAGRGRSRHSTRASVIVTNRVATWGEHVKVEVGPVIPHERDRRVAEAPTLTRQVGRPLFVVAHVRWPCPASWRV